MFSFHPIVMPLNKGSLWAGEGNKVWMRTSTNKLSQQWIWVKKPLNIYTFTWASYLFNLI
jgi:hypothetical protein